MPRYDGKLQQERNCIYFLAIWMVWEVQRPLYNTLVMFIRYYHFFFFQRRHHLLLHFSRLVYVRHASDFLRSGFKLLYILTFVFFGIYIVNRNITWTVVHLLNASNLHKMPKGIFCMAKNLTEVIVNIEPDQRKQFYQVTSYRGKLFMLVNTLIYDMVVTFLFTASLKARLIVDKEKN